MEKEVKHENAKHETVKPGGVAPDGVGAAPDTEQKTLDPNEIRPVTLKDGTHIISGPLPAGNKGGSHNVSGTPGFGFTFHGTAGGSFLIDGAGFNQYGDVFVGGKQVTVTSWQDNKIKGLLPADVDVKGEVKVVDGTGTIQIGPVRTPEAQKVDVNVHVDQGPKAGTPKPQQAQTTDGPGQKPEDAGSPGKK